MNAAFLSVLLIPLGLALCQLLPRLRAAAGALTPWAALPALLLALFGGEGEMRIEWLMLGMVFGLDELPRIFLGAAAVLWLGSGLHARGYMAGNARRWAFELLWLLTMVGNFGLILARDVPGFYLFFALMTFAAYGLVIHDRSAEALRAGRVYMVMAIIGEGLILTGLLLAVQLTASPLLLPLLADVPAAITLSEHRTLIITCLWLGFGIKAGLPLLHMWLPLAHPVAPVPASAVLSGAMIKAGLLGWMNTLPLGVANLETFGVVVIVTGFTAAFGAALIGVNQRTPKTVLAYSSISQMGLITVAIGAALYSAHLWPLLAPVIALYAMHHGLAKGALFLGTGIAQHCGRCIRPWLWVLLALPGLSLAGLMTSGAVSKLGLKGVLYGANDMPEWWSWLPLALSLAAIGTTTLITRYLCLLHGRETGDKASSSEWAGWGLVLAASAVAVLLLPVQDWGGSWPESGGDVFDLAWPVLVGVALSVVAWRFARAWPVPAGDVLIRLESAAAHIDTMARRFGTCLRTRGIRYLTGLNTSARRVCRERGMRIKTEGIFLREAAILFALLLMLFTLT